MTLHVAGAGLAGLAAALTAARAGHRVVVHEAASAAGGRCRSFFDPGMNRSIDNGTHVVLGANRGARDFFVSLAGKTVLKANSGGSLPFVDLAAGEGWRVDVRDSAVRAVFGCAGFRGVASVLGKMLAPDKGATVAEAYGGLGTVYERLIAPFATAVLNQSTEQAPAARLSPLLRRLAAGGSDALSPSLAPRGLSRDWIDPALSALEGLGADVRYRDPLTAIEVADGALHAAKFRTGAVPIGRGDALILALPPWGLGILSPYLSLPHYDTGAIVCAHFLVSPTPRLAGGAGLMGLSGGTAEWLAWRGDVLSVTVSAAERLINLDGASIADVLWHDAANALGVKGASLPPCRVVKERRATVRVPGGFGPYTEIDGLLIAGGWCDRAYPDTIEAAVNSGIEAAKCLGTRA